MFGGETNWEETLRRLANRFTDGPAAELLQDPALGRIYLGGERKGAA